MKHINKTKEEDIRDKVKEGKDPVTAIEYNANTGVARRVTINPEDRKEDGLFEKDGKVGKVNNLFPPEPEYLDADINSLINAVAIYDALIQERQRQRDALQSKLEAFISLRTELQK
jgi:hypothetical protein